MGPKYLPEVDGLRAIAVLAVVAYHAELGGFGFVGVDTFFVISGYLITSLLLKEKARTGRIDLLAFYARRVRRILPAALAVVLIVLFASCSLLPIDGFIQTAESASASALFGANFYFQSVTGGYWNADAEQMPLLHLWSLAVEEQFYLLWPALVLLIPSRWMRPAMLALGLCSLALAEWLTPNAAFYQMPARFWELAAGGLIATLRPRHLPRWVMPAGIAIQLASCVVPMPTFPGLGAIPVVLGSVMIVYAAHCGVRNAFLRSRMMVGVGLISYSLYLWHWPLLAFYRAWGDDPQIRILLGVAAFALAVISYRFIEQPFRRMRFRSGRTVAGGVILASVVTLTACAASFEGRRYAEADADNPLAVFASHDLPSQECHQATMDAPVVKCVIGDSVIWGDSVAWSWSPAFPNASIATRDACPPAVGYVVPVQRFNPNDCVAFNEKVIQAVQGAGRVILASNWRQYPDLDLRGTLDALTMPVLIIGPTPEMKRRVPDCIRKGLDCSVTRKAFDAEAAPILARLRAQSAGHPNVTVVDVTDQFCTAKTCPPVMNGKPLYWDSHHIAASKARSFHPLQ